MSTQPPTGPLRAPRSFWLDFGVFYLGLLWLPGGYFSLGPAYAWLTAVAVAAFLTWAAVGGDRACLPYRILLGLATLAPILGVAYPEHQDGGEFLMILLMTAAGFLLNAKQVKDRRAARIAASRVPT